MLIPSPHDLMVYDDLQEQERDLVDKAIEDMTSIIHQQMEDCKADRQLMKCVMSGSIYGEYYGKRFVHEVMRRGYRSVQYGPEGYQDSRHQRFERWEEGKDQPGWEYKSVWSIFRDLETDDLNKGVGVIERQMISPYELKQKMRLPYFIPENIILACKEAPYPGTSTQGGLDTESLPPGERTIDHRFKTIEYLEFFGRVPEQVVTQWEEQLKFASSLEDYQLDFPTEHDYEGDEVEIMGVMADNQVVRYARTSPGERPHYRGVWEIHLDHVDGVSVADNLVDIQKVLNGLVRSFEDNRRLAGDVILAVKKRYMAPWDEKIYPGVKLEIAEECDDARKAIQQIVIQDTSQGALEGIQYYERKGDEQSMLPRIMQGDVAEKKKPDTLGELQLLYESAGKYLGGVIKNFDEGLLEDLVADFYEYNMEDPDIERGKGNFIAKPLGFTSFQNKVTRVQALLAFLQLSMSNEQMASEVRVRHIMEEYAKNTDLEPAQVLKSDEEKEKDAEMQAKQAQEQKKEMLEMERTIEKMKTDFQAFLEEIKSQAKMEQEDQKHEAKLDEEEQKHENKLEEEELKADLELENKIVELKHDKRAQKAS
jgi:hypothetical protein